MRQEPKDWKLLETPHFRLHYPSDALEERARQFAGWFENARADLAARLPAEPPVVNVFLYRSWHDLQQSSFLGAPATRPLADLARASRVLGERAPPGGPLECRRCAPNAKSRALALAEPLRDRVFIHVQPSDRWNAWFVRHELVHQVQYAHLYAFRLPSWLIALKDPILPAWWWEGGADYFAGAFDPRKEEFVRDLLRERLYDLKELHTTDVLNPYDGLAHYHQGAWFWRFLEEHYGKDVPARLFERTDHGLPIASQKPLEKVVGKKREEVEAEFAAWLRRRWEPVDAGRSHPADRLTDTREYYRRRSSAGRFSPDGSKLAWIGNADVAPDLYVDGVGLLAFDRSVNGTRVFSPPTWSPDGTRLALVVSRTHHDLLLIVGLDGARRELRLPFDELHDPAWSPDGDRIAFAALKDGRSDLHAVRLSDGSIERLTDDADGDFAPAWSRDGRLAWIKETEGRTVLHVSGKGAVTRSWALMEHPQWSPDGKAIAVAADVGGVFDAFSVDPETGRAKRLTRYLGGVSYPSWHADGSLVITYQQGRGTDLYRVRPEPQDAADFDEEGRKPWYEQFRRPVPRGEPAEKSRVWGVNYLQFPTISGSLVLPGLEFSAGDRDAENTLTLQAWGATGEMWSASATVANTRWLPTFGVNALAGREGDLQELALRPFVDVPLWTTLSVGAGWTVRERTQHSDAFPDASFLDSGPGAALLFSNQESYQRRDEAYGLAFGGTAAWFREDFGGERDQNEYFAFGEFSFDLAQDWIVWARASYRKYVADVLLSDELLDIAAVVRGAEDLEGTDLGGATLELRFPLWRDFLWQPLELIGLGEWLILKDLRGFVFGQGGFAGFRPEDVRDAAFGAWSAGGGLRLDLSFMLWPVVNGRVPIRLEGWWAWVNQADVEDRGEVGFGFTLGF